MTTDMAETQERNRIVCLWECALRLSGADRLDEFRVLMKDYQDCFWTYNTANVTFERLRLDFISEDTANLMCLFVNEGIKIGENQLPHLFTMGRSIRHALAKRGFDCNSQDTLGNNPLHLLASMQQAENFERGWVDLMEMGVNLDARNSSGDTPLDPARETPFYENASVLVGQFKSQQIATALDDLTQLAPSKRASRRV